MKVGSVFSGEGNVFFFRVCYLPKCHLKKSIYNGVNEKLA